MVATINSYTDKRFAGWVRLYNLTFLAGLAMSFFVFWALNRLIPVSGLGQEAPFLDEQVVHGVPDPVAADDVDSQPGGKEKEMNIQVV